MKRLTFAIVLVALISICSSQACSQETNRFETGDVEFEMINSVWSTPSKSQGRTGTCWCFSTTSFLETEAFRLTGEKYELSEIFTVYNAYKEKAIRYMRLWGNNNFGQGGLSHDLLYLVPKYGMVRKSDYMGIPEGQEGHNHRELFKSLKEYLDATLKERKGVPEDFTQQCEAILDANVGAIPEKITVDGKEITPVQFASEYLKFDPDNYVELTSYSHLPFYQQVELLIPDNWMRNEAYYNIPLEEFVATAKHALKNGYSFVVDLDVSEKTNLGGKTGIKYMPHDLEGTTIDQAEREEMFNTLSTTDDHLMHTTGIARDGEGIIYFYTKDSGGPDRGPYKGFNYISENYLRGKVLAIFLHKDAIPAEIKAKLTIN